MPTIVQADLWTLPAGQSIADTVFVVTTNNVIRAGALVMGAGAAKQAAQRYAGLPRRAAAQITDSDYGFLIVDWPRSTQAGIGIFQVKRDYRHPAELDLIRRSVAQLTSVALRQPFYFRLNFPGIGAGQLARSEVEPLLAGLPANVTITTY